MAEETGGRMFQVDNRNSLENIFDQIQQEMRTQYAIGYTPTNSSKDGGYRKIDLKTASKDLKVQVRKGYYAMPAGQPVDSGYFPGAPRLARFEISLDGGCEGRHGFDSSLTQAGIFQSRKARAAGSGAIFAGVSSGEIGFHAGFIEDETREAEPRDRFSATDVKDAVQIALGEIDGARGQRRGIGWARLRGLPLRGWVCPRPRGAA